MNPSAVPHAVKQGRQSVTAVVAMATDPGARCSLPYAPNAAKKLKYRSSPVKAGQCIAVSATARKD